MASVCAAASVSFSSSSSRLLVSSLLNVRQLHGIQLEQLLRGELGEAQGLLEEGGTVAAVAAGSGRKRRLFLLPSLLLLPPGKQPAPPRRRRRLRGGVVGGKRGGPRDEEPRRRGLSFQGRDRRLHRIELPSDGV